MKITVQQELQDHFNGQNRQEALDKNITPFHDLKGKTNPKTKNTNETKKALNLVKIEDKSFPPR